jgi:hypothetical protein
MEAIRASMDRKSVDHRVRDSFDNDLAAITTNPLSQMILTEDSTMLFPLNGSGRKPKRKEELINNTGSKHEHINNFHNFTAQSLSKHAPSLNNHRNLFNLNTGGSGIGSLNTAGIMAGAAISNVIVTRNSFSNAMNSGTKTILPPVSS